MQCGHRSSVQLPAGHVSGGAEMGTLDRGVRQTQRNCLCFTFLIENEKIVLFFSLIWKFTEEKK